MMSPDKMKTANAEAVNLMDRLTLLDSRGGAGAPGARCAGR